MRNKKRINTIKNQLESHYGIGKIQSKFICNQLGISLNLRNNLITKYERKKIMDYLRKRTRITSECPRVFPREITYDIILEPQVSKGACPQIPRSGVIHSGLHGYSREIYPQNIKDLGKSSLTIGLSKYSHEVSMVNKINKSPIVDNLKYIQTNNIRDLIKKNTYRGFRHKKGLPVRGQRTRTNRQTRRRLSRKRI